MAAPLIHPNGARPPIGITEGYSLEITAKDVEALREAAPQIPDETPVAITFLPGEDAGARVAAAVAVRAPGLEPMPHFSARRLVSHADVESTLASVARAARGRRGAHVTAAAAG